MPLSADGWFDAVEAVTPTRRRRVPGAVAMAHNESITMYSGDPWAPGSVGYLSPSCPPRARGHLNGHRFSPPFHVPVAVPRTAWSLLPAPVAASSGNAAGGSLAVTTYYYVVTAYTTAGETTASNEIIATTTPGNQTTGLTWNALTGATGYRVYRGTSSGNNNTLVALAPSNSYSDDGSVTVGSVSPPTTNTAGVATDWELPTANWLVQPPPSPRVWMYSRPTQAMLDLSFFGDVVLPLKPPTPPPPRVGHWPRSHATHGDVQADEVYSDAVVGANGAITEGETAIVHGGVIAASNRFPSRRDGSELPPVYSTQEPSFPLYQWSNWHGPRTPNSVRDPRTTTDAHSLFILLDLPTYALWEPPHIPPHRAVFVVRPNQEPSFGAGYYALHMAWDVASFRPPRLSHVTQPVTTDVFCPAAAIPVTAWSLLPAPGGLAAVLTAGGSLTVAQAYYYVVTTRTVAGESTASSEVSATPTLGNQTVNLTWTAVPYATDYRVYRGTSPGANTTLIAQVTTASHSDTGAATIAAQSPPSTNTAGVNTNWELNAHAWGVQQPRHPWKALWPVRRHRDALPPDTDPLQHLPGSFLRDVPPQVPPVRQAQYFATVGRATDPAKLPESDDSVLIAWAGPPLVPAWRGHAGRPVPPATQRDVWFDTLRVDEFMSWNVPHRPAPLQAPTGRVEPYSFASWTPTGESFGWYVPFPARASAIWSGSGLIAAATAIASMQGGSSDGDPPWYSSGATIIVVGPFVVDMAAIWCAGAVQGDILGE